MSDAKIRLGATRRERKRNGLILKLVEMKVYPFLLIEARRSRVFRT